MDTISIKTANHLTYGSIISFMLDYLNANTFNSIAYDTSNFSEEIIQSKNEDYAEFLKSRSFLFSHGVFNEYCYFYQFKNNQDLINNFFNTLFIVLPGFEFDSTNDFKKMLKKIKNSGIFQKEDNTLTKQQIDDNYRRFKQEIIANHVKSLKLMNKENRKVNYNDCVLIMHIKSGKFLEYKLNNKNFKTYIQLTNHISQKTLFRFVPAYEYQAATSTFCIYNLAIQIACGEKKAKKEKYIVNENISKNEEVIVVNSSLLLDKGENILNNNKNENKNNRVQNGNKKSIFDIVDLKNTINNIFNYDKNDPILDEFVNYIIHENLNIKNFGVKLMPEENYVVVDDSSFSFWRLLNFSEDYFEDIKYLNLLDYFCIENTDTKLFIHLEEIESEEQNFNSIEDNINNELFPEMEESEEINEIKNESKEEDKSPNISDIINAKENIPFTPIINESKHKNNINDSKVNNKIEINYFYDSMCLMNKNYNLIIDSYKDKKERIKPYSLFKFETMFDIDNDIDINTHCMRNMNIIKEDIPIRLINVFTNRILCIEQLKNGQYKLVLTKDINKNDKRYPFTFFYLKPIKNMQEIEESEEQNEAEDKKDENNGQEIIFKGISKKCHFKIYSKKCSAYIGIRKENKNKELVLTNSMCDITVFTLNCLDEEDKYELNFFEQLLLSFDNILNYFKREDTTFKSIGQNYERINHIFITLKLKLKQFTNDNRDVTKLNLQQNKFDFVEIIGHFGIVSKLIELFLTNWFKNYQVFSYDDLESIIKKYFKDNNDILKYKLLISRQIVNILAIIYNLNNSYLNVIEDTLLYFFMFVGRDDKITKFLVEILKNNKLLLISLCPFSNDNIGMKEEQIENKEDIKEINRISMIKCNEELLKRKKKFKKFKFCNIKKCLKRIIHDYNNMTKEDIRINFSSLALFFNLLNNLLILDNKPFKQFIDDYFTDLKLLKNEDNLKVPNFEKNPILNDFFIKNGEIYVRKISFKCKNDNKNYLVDEKLLDLIDIISNYNTNNEMERDKILFAKLVSLNLFFYSFLSLCFDEFKNYIKNIFKFDYIIKNYLTFSYNIIENYPDENLNINLHKKIGTENPLMNDLKCSLIQLLTYGYLKVPNPFALQTHLFKVINSEQRSEEIVVDKFEIQTIINFIFKVLGNNTEKLDLKKVDHYCLIQVLELIKYCLRNLYLKKKNIVESDMLIIYNLIVNVMNLIDKFFGESKEKSSKIVNSFISLINDKLNLKNPMLLVSENIQYLFLKYKNTLEREIIKKYQKGNNIKIFLNILTDVCDKERIQKNKYDARMAELTKKNITILRNFNLKNVIIDVSIQTDRSNASITNLTLLIIEEIILEFLNYLEYSTIESLHIGDISDGVINIKKCETNLKEEILKKNNSTKYYDKFKEKKFSLTSYFFKFLFYFDNTKIKNSALEIIYKLNNSKKIFYFDIENIVILKDEKEYMKLMEIKDIFCELIEKVNDLNLIQRLDKNSIVIFNKIKEKLELLLKKSFNEVEWDKVYNIVNENEDLNFEDSFLIQNKDDSSLYSSREKIDEEEDDKESQNQSDNEEVKKKNIDSEYEINNEIDFSSKEALKMEKIDTSTKNKENNHSKNKISNNKYENDYFLNEYEPENLLIYQKSLYNLGFIYFINEYFNLVDKLSENKSELVGDLFCIEESLIKIYKILEVFIAKNEKNQSIVKNRLYLYICPLQIKKLSQNLLKSINNFIFNLVYNFKKRSDYGKISNIDLVVKRLYLLHQIDWNEQKDVMPNFVKTLLIFFQYSSPEYINLIFQLLDDIKKIVTTDILKGNINENSRIILTKLLEFIEIEIENKNLKENRNRPLLSIKDIIRTFPILLKQLTPKTKFDIENDNFEYSKPLVLITNLLFDYYHLYYKNYVEENKFIILESLLTFCHEANIKEEFIYKGNINESKKKNNHLKYFNEFMGLSLPKLFIILNEFGLSEGIEEILLKSRNFYEKIEIILEKNKNEKIFLEEGHIKEVNEICLKIGEGYLDPLFNIIEKKNLFDNSSNSLLERKTPNKYSNKKIYALRKPSNKRIFFDKSYERKTFLIDNFNNKIIEADFEEKAKNEIIVERQNFINNELFKFFDFIKGNNNNKDYNNIPNILSFYINFCNSFTKHYENYILKNHFFFFYWTNIFLMQFNVKEEQSFQEKTKYNKEYFNDLSLIEFTIERFETINLNINNYENLLYIKFLDSYLYQLNEENTAQFLNKIIEKPESRNLFNLLHNILDNFSEKINNDFQESDEQKEQLFNKCPASIFEKEIDEYDISIKFLSHLSQTNNIIKNKMKDYLRLQYNNIINNNFIIILSDILEGFGNEKTSKFIFTAEYYPKIIYIIEFIIQCCDGPCKENQECVVKDTKILYFIKFILKHITYRERKFCYDEPNKDEEIMEENEEGQNTYKTYEVKYYQRRRLAFLKYKLLQLLNSLTIGRKKGDKIFDLIHQIIDFKVLIYVLIETFKEILIEKNAQDNPDNFIFEENILSRMNDTNIYLNEEENNNDNGKNFIIFENGTYAFILIDIYLENLTRLIDLHNYNTILDLKKRLQKKRYDEKSNKIFENLIGFVNNLRIFYKLIISKPNKDDKDFQLRNSFNLAYSFYFDYTPNIEILHDGKIYKYYIRLSPICKCLTREMKDKFYSRLDRSSSKTKTTNLFKKVEFFRYQLIMNKKILDAFNKAPILNLFFNQYKFYRDIFLIIAIIINLLIFVSFHRITEEGEKPMKFGYDFLYKKGNGDNKNNKTRITFLVFTIIEMIFSILILINYLIFRVSYFLYFKTDKEENEVEDEKEDKDGDKPTKLKNFSKSEEILKYLFERLGTFLLNIIKDLRLIYYLILLIVIIITIATEKFKYLSILLIDIIERSSTLMCIVKSFWIARIQIIVTLLLFYIVAYYFIILIYLFIPDHLPSKDCLKFSNCYFVLCDQTIKNSNGIINYLTDDGLYIFSSMWQNPRFWIDNWFAIIDLILVIQMFCGIIIDTYLSQKEENKKIEDDKNNKCFICGLKKNDLNKYSNSEKGFNEHIKLQHYLWNYMFAIFNVTSGDYSYLPFLDNAIKEGYESRSYSKWIPYKKCLNQLESNFYKKENEELENKDNEKDGED